ncbi:MAG: hypothetical protein HRT88_15035 [Lentisphaeraceae bacterium]|nr:hypothetical protein [Lentisphaeraceae bacterium]
MLLNSCSYSTPAVQHIKAPQAIPLSWKLVRQKLDFFIKNETHATADLIKITPKNNFLNFLCSSQQSSYSALPLSKQIAVKVYCPPGTKKLPQEMLAGARPTNCTVKKTALEGLYTIHTIASYQNKKIYLYFYIGAAEIANYTQRSPYTIKMENAPWTTSTRP